VRGIGKLFTQLKGDFETKSSFVEEKGNGELADTINNMMIRWTFADQVTTVRERSASRENWRQASVPGRGTWRDLTDNVNRSQRIDDELRPSHVATASRKVLPFDSGGSASEVAA